MIKAMEDANERMNSRGEYPDDHTIADDRTEGEDDVEESQRVVEEGIGGLETPPEGINVLQIIRRCVIPKHLDFIAPLRDQAVSSPGMAKRDTKQVNKRYKI